ncbi:hypothetical protein BT96DRAFT_715644 [Gymnopus androsaceus JB14]|uniref:Uncharacterized protein n=1 Tax=Gymnopus androsaceus JB14 TaxID=1447944 RepID=A0A6A4HQ49_9AGAR|nr:hypothetical protein BT96DRAFT_715644 [Gymnopus androsaceus JB14]
MRELLRFCFNATLQNRIAVRLRKVFWESTGRNHPVVLSIVLSIRFCSLELQPPPFGLVSIAEKTCGGKTNYNHSRHLGKNHC